MLQRVSFSTVKVRPTDRKIKKSVCAAQQMAVSMKRQASIDSKQTMTRVADAISFLKSTLCHKAN